MLATKWRPHTRFLLVAWPLQKTTTSWVFPAPCYNEVVTKKSPNAPWKAGSQLPTTEKKLECISIDPPLYSYTISMQNIKLSIIQKWHTQKKLHLEASSTIPALPPSFPITWKLRLYKILTGIWEQSYPKEDREKRCVTSKNHFNPC